MAIGARVQAIPAGERGIQPATGAIHSIRGPTVARWVRVPDGIAQVEFALPFEGEPVERRVVAERGEGGVERAEVGGGDVQPRDRVEDDARLARR